MSLYQNTHRPATPFFWQLPARRPDPAFPAERDGSPPRAHRTFRHRTCGGAANRAQDVRLRDRPRANVVQEAVIRLADDGIRRAHVLIAGEREEPGEHR